MKQSPRSPIANPEPVKKEIQAEQEVPSTYNEADRSPLRKIESILNAHT